MVTPELVFLHTVNAIALRCDYLLVGQAVNVADRSCEVWHWFQMSNTRPDHMPVSAVVSLSSPARPPISRRRTAKYDRKAVKAACDDTDGVYRDRVERLRLHLLSLPPVPFTIDPSTHIYIQGLQAIFPLCRTSVKQGYIAEDTFILILVKGRLQHSLTALGMRLKSSPLRFVVRVLGFAVCRSGQFRRPWWCKTRGFKPKFFCMQQFHTLKAVLDISIRVKDLKRRDYDKLCTAQAKSLEETALENCTSKLYGLMKGLQPFQPYRDTRIMDKDEVPARSDTEERLIVRSHFRDCLEGEDTTISAIIGEDRRSCVASAVELRDIPLDIDALPSKQLLTRMHAKGRMNGVGEACIGGECSRLLALATSALFFQFT